MLTDFDTNIRKIHQVVTYDKLMAQPNLADFVETIAGTIYQRLYPILADR